MRNDEEDQITDAQYLAAAKAAVLEAETAKTNLTRKIAMNLVKALPVSKEKTDLEVRLEAIVTVEDMDNAPIDLGGGVTAIVTGRHVDLVHDGVGTGETERQLYGMNPFKDIEILTATIGEGVTVIGEATFEVSALTDVTLPSTLIAINDYVFSSSKLTEIDIPEGVTHIGAAFTNNNISKLTLPSTLKTLGNIAFSGNNLTQVILPEELKSIGHSAFANNAITEVIIPSKITNIKHNMFEDNKLTKVTIPEAVTEIEKEAFKNNDLTEVVFKPKNVPTIGVNAFQNNTLKAKAIAPIERIGKKTGMYRANRYPFDRDLILNEGIVYSQMNITTQPTKKVYQIGEELDLNGMVVEVYSLVGDKVKILKPEEYTIGEFDNTNIGPQPITISTEDASSIVMVEIQGPEYDFDASTGTIKKYTGTSKDIDIPSKIDDVTVREIGAAAFSTMNITSIRIPEGVEILGSVSFAGNKLTNITLPRTLTSIGANAFRDNDLTYVTFKSLNVPTIESTAFMGNKLNALAKVPQESIGTENGMYNKDNYPFNKELTIIDK